MRSSAFTEKPWGGFHRFAWNERSTVKILTLSPGGRLSLQRHQHRDELWRVLDGGLTVEIDGAVHDAQRDDEFWIPRGTLHRAVNPKIALRVRILEIAFGDFDEEDIERVEDAYGRMT